MVRITDRVSYTVKNSFVEFGQADEAGFERVRARSDGTELNRAQQLKGPQSPEEFAELEAAQKARVVVPNTPSPFLHPSAHEPIGSMPPLSLMEPAGGYDELSFGDVGPEELFGHQSGCFDGGDMQGFCYFPVPGMYDPSTGEFLCSGGWYMPAEGMVMVPQGACEADACGVDHLGQPLEAPTEDHGPQFEVAAHTEAAPEGGAQMEGGNSAPWPLAEQGSAAEGPAAGEAWQADAAAQSSAAEEPAAPEGAGWGEGRAEAAAAWGRKGGRGGRRQPQAAGGEEPAPRGGAGGRLDGAPAAAKGGGGARGEAAEGGGHIAGSGLQPTDTTVMLRNIPNKYTREMLVNQLNSEFRGRFDFVYLPIDFKNRCNVGYGFINFRTGDACAEFFSKFNGVDVRKCLPGLNSRKVAEVTPARVQGLDENVRRLRNGPVMNELMHHPEWMPLLLGEGGEERKFPLPDQPCPPVKPRRRTGREDHGGGRGW